MLFIGLLAGSLKLAVAFSLSQRESFFLALPSMSSSASAEPSSVNFTEDEVNSLASEWNGAGEPGAPP